MQQKQVNMRLLLVAAPVVVAMMVLGKFHQLPVTVNSPHRLIMGTVARIVVVTKNTQTGRAAIAAGFQKMELVDGLMSTYRADSEISIVNDDAYERPVPVSAETFTVLTQAQEFSRLSDGAFDITVGPLLALWHAAADTNTAPTDAQISVARAHVGWENLHLDPNTQTVRFGLPGMKLDLGGIAKGYAIDLALEAVRDANALGAMVDIGGDIRCFGQPPHHQPHWRIGLQDPNITDPNAEGDILLVLHVDDRAVATSGHYRRFALIGNEKVSHIVEPRNGHGSQRLASTTLIAPDAITADALATAVSVLGQEKGIALIETLPNVEALLIPNAARPDLRVESSGAQNYTTAVDKQGK